MRFSRHKLLLSGLFTSLASRPKRGLTHTPENTGHRKALRPWRPDSNPLLNISIARRLALGFLIPALIAIITLSSVSIQSQQRISQEAIFYQNLLTTYTSLTAASGDLQQMQDRLLQTVSYATHPHSMDLILNDYRNNVRISAKRYNILLSTYLKRDLIVRYPDLMALFVESGHASQVEEQQTYSLSVEVAWQAYHIKQEEILSKIDTEDQFSEHVLDISQANIAFEDVERDLHTLIAFSGSLAPSLHDAANVEVQKLVLITILSGLGVFLGIGIVGWLISSTLVQRLQRLRFVVQAIAAGQVDARLDARGRDEIADVSKATNRMVDTLVGLLEETRKQHDELVKGEELKYLHQALQQEHEALNEANSHLETLATVDPLTGLPNHRTVIARVEEELLICQQTQKSCAILFLDIDHFKCINDTWGHRAGDMILYEVGRRIASTLRQEDFVGRYGGEEFAIILTDTDLQEAKNVAERLCEVLAKDPYLWDMDEAQSCIAIPVTGSFGISIYQKHGITRETLIEAADSAMYQAKRSGRNRVCVAGSTELPEVQNVLGTFSERQIQQTLATKALIAAANAHDQETGAHAVRLVEMVEATARQLGCSEEEIHLARVAALLHDIGKIGVPDRILHKPGPLTDEEWDVMRKHPQIGHHILAQVGEKFELVSHIVVAHHERWDGRGYPYGLSRDMIPLGARILTVADSYDAMTSDRPYRAALSSADAQAELRTCAGHQFDPRVVEAFIQVLIEQGSEALSLPLQSIRNI